jgi:hypothetical protein
MIMNHSGQTTKTSPASIGHVIRTRWLNFRRKRFWLLVCILLYTLLGFLLAPVMVKKGIVSLLQEDLGRQTQIEKVQVNPYVLSLKIQGFSLADKDAARLASFDEFFVNFQLSSLFKTAWTFDQIRLVEPYFLMERFDETDSRLNRIITDFNALQPTETDPVPKDEPAGTMPRLLIHDLSMTGGHVDLKDNLPATTVETQLSPINISIQDLSTLPDLNGRQSVTIQLDENASLKWDGSLTLGPLDSKGELTLENLHLDPIIAYLQSSMPLESLSATLSTRFKYHVHMDLGGLPEVVVSDLDVELEAIEVKGLTPATEIIAIPKLSLTGGVMRYPQQNLQFSRLQIDQPQLVAWLKEDGNLSLTDLVPSTETTVDTDTSTTTTAPWQIGIDEFELTGGAIDFSDNSIQPAAKLNLDDLAVSLSGFNNQNNTSMPMKINGKLSQGGGFGMNGTLNLLPDISLTATINTQELPLNIGQVYAQQFAHIKVNKGSLNSDIKLNYSGGQNLSANGSIQIPGLDVINTIDDGQLLSWDSLDIDQFQFDLASGSIALSQLSFDHLFGTFILDENKVTNIAALIIEQPEEPSDSNAKPMNLVIGGIVIKDSSMDFSDLSLPLPFATHIINLDGSISTIDLASDTPANIKLEGQVDEYGLARINGSMNVMDPVKHTDVTVEFRNLLMSNLSPYTVQFAGREIDKGKLNLDLGYVIEKGLLNGKNNVVLNDLELGEKVDHPDATSLPLGLAVSLLKDSDGVIKIDLPVTGDINDPEFEIGGVVWQAISGMITKLVTAPFRLLGNLIGIDSEDLGQFEFLAGRFDLTPPELEKVTQLEEALQQRPELVVEISGVMDPALDGAALKRIKLVSVATERLGEEIDSKDNLPMMLDERIRKLVDSMFSERFPDVDRAAIKTQFTAPPASDPEAVAVLDELAYATALWTQMLDAESISPQALSELATARAQGIKDAFLSSGKFAESRVVIGSTKEVESEDQEWVVLELSVAAK